MATFATNFTSCSAENVNVCLILGCGEPSFGVELHEAYDFWLPTTCRLNACFIVS